MESTEVGETDSVEVTEMTETVQLSTGDELRVSSEHLEIPISSDLERNSHNGNDGVEQNLDLSHGMNDRIGEEGEEVPSTFQNTPCLGCGSNCFIKSEPIQGEEEPEHSGTELLLKFGQFLRIKNVKHWTGHAPICCGCTNQLTLLLDLERKLKELERDFQNGVKEFRKMCQDAEGVFRRSGIYDKDQRYYNIRKQVVGGVGPGRPRKKQSDKGGSVSSRELNSPRRSERVPKSIRTKGLSALSMFSPVVAVSATDRAKADEFQMVKTEVISGNELDNDTDGFQLDSPMQMDTGNEDVSGNDRPYEATNTLQSDDLFQQPTENNRRKRQYKPRGSLKPKRKPKKRKPLKVKRPPKPRGPSDAERKIVIIDDPELLDSFIYGDSEDEAVKEKKTRPNRRKNKDEDYEPDDKNAEDEAEADEDIWDEKERTQHNPETGEYIVLHIIFKPIYDGSEKFKCSDCAETVARSSFRKHTFKYHTARFRCKECGQCEGSQSHLKRHIRYKHQDKKPRNECPICGKPCSGVRDRFLNHLTTHYSEQDKAEAIARGEKLRMWKDRRTIQCDHCGKKFVSKKELERHTLSRHPKPEDASMMLMYKELCPDCGKLVDKHYINLHRLRSHNISMDANLAVGSVLEKEPQANRRFICTVCDKRFFKSKELVRHKMSIHDKIYPFKCELCPRAFLLQRQLDRHMNTHSNIRPFACSYCPMAFFTNGNLTRHINIYHAEGANPKRKAYVRGTTSFNAKRFQTDSDNVPPSDANVGAPRSIAETSVSNQHEDMPHSSGIQQIPDPSKEPGNEAELIESIIQFQSAMSSSGAASVPAPVIQSTSNSYMQELFMRHNQNHPT